MTGFDLLWVELVAEDFGFIWVPVVEVPAEGRAKTGSTSNLSLGDHK